MVHGMAVAYVISAEQRAIETVASMDISHSDVCLNTPLIWRANNQAIQKIGVAKAIQTIFSKCSDRCFDGSTAASAS